MYSVLTTLLTNVSHEEFLERWREFWSIKHLIIVFLKLSVIPITFIIVNFLVFYAISKVKRMDRLPYSAEDVVNGTWEEKQKRFNSLKKKREMNKEVKLSKSSSAIEFVFKFWYYSHFKPQLLQKEKLKVKYIPTHQRSLEVESMYEVVKIKFAVALKNKLINRDQIKALCSFIEEQLEIERYPKTKNKEKRYKNDAHYIYSCLKHSEKLNKEHLVAINDFIDEWIDLESITERVDETEVQSSENIEVAKVLSISDYETKSN